MTHKRADCCFREPKTTSHPPYGAGEGWYPPKYTASSLSVISDVNTQRRGGSCWKYLETTGCLQSDHRGCYSSTVFGSSVCHSQSWSSPTDPSLKASSHHPSQSDMSLLPAAPREACHSNLRGGYWDLAALPHTHTHTFTITGQGKRKRGFIPTGTATCLTCLVYLNHLPPPLSLHMSRHSSFQSQNEEITDN